MKIIAYILLLIFFSICMKLTSDYPILAFIFASAWCVSGFLLIKNVLETKINKKQ